MLHSTMQLETICLSTIGKNCICRCTTAMTNGRPACSFSDIDYQHVILPLIQLLPPTSFNLSFFCHTYSFIHLINNLCYYLGYIIFGYDDSSLLLPSLLCCLPFHFTSRFSMGFNDCFIFLSFYFRLYLSLVFLAILEHIVVCSYMFRITFIESFSCFTSCYACFILLWKVMVQTSSSIQLSDTGRLLDIKHNMWYEYTTPPLLPGQLRQPRQVDLSVTFHTADSKPVTS